MEMAPKEREALVNRGLLALVALTDLFKATTELVKVGNEFAKEALAEAQEQKARRSRMN